MRKLFFLLPFLFWLGCQPSQKINETTTSVPEFPKDWLGKWSGQLDVYNSSQKKVMEVKMGLHILPNENGNYSWTIIYGEGEKADVRNYELIAKDAEKGHYLVDEKNSIVLDDYLFQNKLYSRFDVMDNLLLVSYELRGDQLIYEAISGKNKFSVTGGQDSIPEVKSYAISSMQRGVMVRE